MRESAGDWNRKLIGCFHEMRSHEMSDFPGKPSSWKEKVIRLQAILFSSLLLPCSKYVLSEMLRD